MGICSKSAGIVAEMALKLQVEIRSRFSRGKVLAYPPFLLRRGMAASTQRRSSLLAFLRSIGAKALRGGLAKSPFCVHKTRRLLRKSRRVFLKRRRVLDERHRLL